MRGRDPERGWRGQNACGLCGWQGASRDVDRNLAAMAGGETARVHDSIAFLRAACLALDSEREGGPSDPSETGRNGTSCGHRLCGATKRTGVQTRGDVAVAADAGGHGDL